MRHDDLDPRWSDLLAAARAWRDTLIPATSTGTAKPTRRLVDAINAFDQCAHPRLAHVFHLDGSIECSACTAVLVKPDPDWSLQDHQGEAEGGDGEPSEDGCEPQDVWPGDCSAGGGSDGKDEPDQEEDVRRVDLSPSDLSDDAHKPVVSQE